ncbi:hypothetical protein L208DRAFT_1222043, partial [Tricholoma matsutake]
PLLIIAWIMSQCDSVNPDGSKKQPMEYHCAWTYTMKMRAAMTHGFGQAYEQGNLPWTRCRNLEKWWGNASNSTFVSCYMHGLKRRKVH